MLLTVALDDEVRGAVCHPRLPALLVEIGTLHLDRGYDSDATLQRTRALGLHDVICAKRRPPGTQKTKAKAKAKHSLGMR